MIKHVHILSAALALVLAAGCSKPDGQRDVEAGVRELRRGNDTRAKTFFEKAIARRPGHVDNAMVHNYLGIAAWRLGRLDEAVTAFEDSRRLNPNLIEPIYNLGVLAAERDDPRNALRFLNEAATLNRTDPRPLEYLAELHMQRGEWGAARNTLYSALDREPRSARIYNNIAHVHVQLGQPAQAIEALMMALEINTKYAPALFNLAVAYDTLAGDPDQARAYYKRFLSAAPRDERVETVRAALNRIDQRGAASAPRALVDADAPATQASLASETTPPPDEVAPSAAAAEPVAVPVAAPPPAPPASLAAVDAMLRQAEQRARSGQVQQAIDTYVRAAETAANEGRVDIQEKAYREAVRVAVDQPRAHALLGQHLYERGQYEKAAASFRQSATLNADYAPAQLGLARLAMRNAEYDAAMVHFRKVIESDPTLSDAQWEYAMLFDKNLGLAENAAKAYRSFARNFPNDTRREAALVRAEALAPTPKPPAAPTNRPVASVPAEPRSPDAAPSRRIEYKPPTVVNARAAADAYARGGFYHEQRDWDRAIFFYTRALENNDQMPGVFYNLGICYAMKGDNDLARDAYRRAIRLDGNLVDAKYNLALLYRDIKDNTSAIRLLEEILRAKPGYAAAHYALGLIYSGNPETYGRAKQHYQEFLRLAPNDRSAAVIRQWVNSH